MFSEILAAFNLLGESRRFSIEQRQSARISLSVAFHATEGYYAALAAGAVKSPAREYEIAQMWDELAIRLEPVDSSLANRIGLKSRYWCEGAAWSDSQVAAAKIRIQDIRRETHFALVKG